MSAVRWQSAKYRILEAQNLGPCSQGKENNFSDSLFKAVLFSVDALVVKRSKLSCDRETSCIACLGFVNML